MFIKLIAPQNNIPEREYIIVTLLQEFLDLNCEIEFDDTIENYLLEFGSKRIIIEDHFFNNHTDSLSYLRSCNIPVTYSTIEIYNLPIIFGRDYLEISKDEIICGLDIFASAFFMLTRWEEFVLHPGKDGLRCDESELFCIRNGLFHRPLVNEYLIMVIDFFSHFGLNIKPKRKFSIFQTHDVDRLYLSTFTELITNIIDMVFTKKLYQKAWRTFWRYFYYQLLFSNPFDSFDDLMNLSDSLNLKNSFYFKTCTVGEKGVTYLYNEVRTIRVIENIIKRGHKVGFHPSENTFNNEIQFEKEYDRLLKISTLAKGGRQHNLLYNQHTFRFWEKQNLDYDSGYGFQYHNGFRCGICYDFAVFDVFKRKKLKLREIPFLLMDSVFIRKKSTRPKMEEESLRIIDIVKHYNGILCTIWHTNLFKAVEGKQIRELYYRIMRYAVNGKK